MRCILHLVGDYRQSERGDSLAQADLDDERLSFISSARRQWGICKHSCGNRRHFAVAKSKQFPAQKATGMQTVAAFTSSIFPKCDADMKISRNHGLGMQQSHFPFRRLKPGFCRSR